MKNFNSRHVFAAQTLESASLIENINQKQIAELSEQITKTNNTVLILSGAQFLTSLITIGLSAGISRILKRKTKTPITGSSITVSNAAMLSISVLENIIFYVAKYKYVESSNKLSIQEKNNLFKLICNIESTNIIFDSILNLIAIPVTYYNKSNNIINYFIIGGTIRHITSFMLINVIINQKYNDKKNLFKQQAEIKNTKIKKNKVK